MMLDKLFINGLQGLKIPEGFDVDAKKGNVNGNEMVELSFTLKKELDNAFLKRLYESCADISDDPNLTIEFTPEEFERAELPLSRAYSVRQERSVEVFRQYQGNPLGSFLDEMIHLQFSQLDNPKIHVSSGKLFRTTLEHLKQELGLDMCNVLFDPVDYNKMKEWLPDKFAGHARQLENVTLEEDELKIAEAVLGRPIGIEHVPIHPVQRSRYARTSIEGFYTYVDPLLEETEIMLRKGLDSMKGSTIEKPPKYDKQLIHDEIERTLQMADGATGVRALDSFLQSFDHHGHYRRVVGNFDAEYLTKKKDADILTECYCLYLDDRINSSIYDTSPIIYQASGLPADVFPHEGDINSLDCITAKIHMDRWYEDNAIKIKRGLVPNYKEIVIRANTGNPKLKEAQEMLLDHLGVDIS